jgi:hypothetical protein
MNKLGSVAVVVLSVSLSGTAVASPLDLPVDPPDVLPQLPVPTPSIPKVPSVPSVPDAPSVNVPSPIPGAPPISVPQTGSAPQSQSQSAPATRAPARAPAARGGASAGGSYSTSSGASTPTAAGGRDVRSVRARRGGSPLAYQTDRDFLRELRRDRDLRKTVMRLEPCLSHLPDPERRVAALRAGLGEPRTRTRARVAQLLDVTRQRVAQVERRAVRRLRSFQRTQGCGSAGGASGEADDGIAATLAGGVNLALGFLSGGSTGTQALAGAQDTEASAGTKGSSKDRGAVKGEQADSPPLGGLVPTSPEGIGLTLPLLLALAGGGWLLARRKLRRGPETAE